MSDKNQSALDLEIELKLANFKLDIVQEITRMLPRSETPIQTLNFIMDRIFSLVEMEGASILLLDASGDKLEFFMVRGEKEGELTGVKMDAAKGIAGKVIASGETVLIENTEKDRDFYKTIDETVGYSTRSLIAVPLKSGDRVIGVLEGVNIDDEEVKSPAQLSEVFESLAGVISMTLENERLIEGMKNDVERKQRLLDVSHAVNSSLSLSDVLSAVMNAAKDILGVEAASLLLLDNEKENLVFHVVTGEKKRDLEKVSISASTGIAGACATSGAPIICNDVHSDSRFDGSLDKKTGFVTRSVLCVPLRSDNEVSGVLQAINKKGDAEFDEDDLALLDMISSESAVAVRNSLLMNQKNEMFMGAVASLSKALESKDPCHAGHAERVAKLAECVAGFMRPDDIELREILRVAGLTHDAGKLAVPDAILLKSSVVDSSEMDIIKKHAALSCEIINPIGVEKEVSAAVLRHHERWDGTGYPEGLAGADIPLASRILAVADAFDAMTSPRPHREKLSTAEAVEEIKRNSGSQFDPAVVESFVIAWENDMLDIAN